MSSVLPAEAEVVVIGGGVVGASTAYHLVKAGVQNAPLLEWNRLNCGTTWYSAAHVGQLLSSENLTRLIQDGAELYARPEAETGQEISCDEISTQSSGCLSDLFDSLKQRVIRKARFAAGQTCALRAGSPCARASRDRAFSGAPQRGILLTEQAESFRFAGLFQNLDRVGELRSRSFFIAFSEQSLPVGNVVGDLGHLCRGQ